MNRYTALQLIDLQVSTLFVCDADRRLRYIREPGYEESELESAPRFFMGRTLQGNTWRFRYDLPDSLVQPIEQLCRSEPVAVDFADPPQNAAAIRAILNEHAPITNEERGPAYSIPDSVRAPFGAGDMPARLWRAGHLSFAGTGCSRCIVPGGGISPRRAWRASWVWCATGRIGPLRKGVPSRVIKRTSRNSAG